MQATHAFTSCKLLTRSYLAGYSRVHILQVTHEVISCRLLTRSHLASYSQGHTVQATHAFTSCKLLTRSYRAGYSRVHILLVTHEVMSCSARFKASVALLVRLKSSRRGGFTSAAGKLPSTFFPLVTEVSRSLIQRFLQPTQISCSLHILSSDHTRRESRYLRQSFPLTKSTWPAPYIPHLFTQK